MALPLIAARAYAAAQAQATSLAQAVATANSSRAPDPHAFSEILKNAVTNAVQSSQNAEHAMAAQVQGKGDLIDTVTAISDAEGNLNTVMAVRDRVISAYEEIMKMPI